MKYSCPLGIALMSLLVVSGCKPTTTEAKAPQPRPVLTVVAKLQSERLGSFAGTIQPRYQTDRGFLVLGRIIARNVDVGDLVKVGQTLAQLDPLVLDLAVRSSEAELIKATAQLSNTTGAEARTGTLLSRQVSSQADFENAQQARAAATAAVQQAEANLAKAREQRSYATLISDIDGVVTATDAEVGQTVAPGKKVMTLARTDARDAVVDLPEDVTRSLSVGTMFAVVLQADPSIRTTGKVREIAPQADASTRTRRVRITLDQFSEAFRLGATISAVPQALAPDSSIDIPASAVLDREGTKRVWVVDPASRTVRTIPVQVSRLDSGTARIASSLAVGTRVVVAGVNSLKEGQSVKIDERADQ